MKHTYSGKPARPWPTSWRRHPAPGMVLPIETVGLYGEDAWRDASGVIWFWCPQNGWGRARNQGLSLWRLKLNERRANHRPSYASLEGAG